MAKGKFENKHNVFRLEIIEQLKMKACRSTKESNFQRTSVLKVKKANFNLDGDRYLVEVSQNGLIDNRGYSYEFDVLDTVQLCELGDELL